LIERVRTQYLGLLKLDFQQRVREELDLVGKRLIGSHNELFSQYDRLRAESEFRLALVTPLIGLMITLSVLGSWAWLFGITAPVLLYIQGLSASQQSGDLLVDALSIGRVQPPFFERMANDIKGLTGSAPGWIT
jgi:hypothetical protein